MSSTGSSQTTVGQAIDQIIAALSPLEKRQQQTIVSTVCEFLELSPPKWSAGAAGIEPPVTAARQNNANTEIPAPPPAAPPAQVLDIRTLKNQKQPDSAAQMACLVAYYLTEHGDRESGTITSADLEKYFKQAGFPLPKALDRVLIDGKRAGYFEGAGRGEYKLSRVGYNLVAHALPKSNKGA